jgi:hypothetical protein
VINNVFLRLQTSCNTGNRATLTCSPIVLRSAPGYRRLRNKIRKNALMRIIETRGAPNPRRVRIFLAEKLISVPF